MSSYSRTPRADELPVDTAGTNATPNEDYRWVHGSVHGPVVAELQRVTAALAAARADAALWQARYLEYRELVLLVEDFADNRDQDTAMALIDAFYAFRALVEGKTPRAWVVGEAGDPWLERIDEWEPTRVDQDAGDVPWARETTPLSWQKRN